MANDRHPIRIPPGAARHNFKGATGRPLALDWPAWIDRIERKRRGAHRNQRDAATPNPQKYFIDATCSSFRLEGIDVSLHEVHDALESSPNHRKLRSRAAQRIRNHVAILHSIDRTLHKNQALKTEAVLRWYTSISSGLSTSELGIERMNRLDQIVRGIDSPQLRLQPALQEIARTHVELLSDSLFPSFNGILSRLLMRYHLGRCGLPAIVFDEAIPLSSLAIEQSLTMSLLVAIDESYDLLLQ